MGLLVPAADRGALAEAVAQAASTIALARATTAGRGGNPASALAAARYRADALLSVSSTTGQHNRVRLGRALAGVTPAAVIRPPALLAGSAGDADRAVPLRLPGRSDGPRPGMAPAWERPMRWLRNAGVILLVAFTYQLWGTGLAEAHSQDRLTRAFREQVRQLDTGAATATPAAAATAPQPEPPPQGEVVAMLRVPAIGLDKAVVEGTNADVLRRGPGHYAGTAMPGMPGNFAVAGHRTTYGAPFARLDELAPGDEVLVTTVAGAFRYVVSEPPRVVAPEAAKVLADQGDTRLTLTTCNPEWSAAERLVVVATLVGPDTTSAPAA